MKTDLFYKIFATFLLLSSPCIHAEGSNQTTGLEQAKIMAVERNAALAAKKAEIDVALAKEGRGMSSFYPSLETKFGTESVLNSNENQGSNFGYLQGNWNLYRGGLDSLVKDILALETKKATIAYEIEKLKLESSVEEIFSKILFSRDLVEIKKRFIQLNAEQRSFAKQMMARGSGSESDVLEFDLRATELESDLSQLQQEYLGHIIKLKVLLGEDTRKPLSLSGELPHQHLTGSLENYVDLNLSDSPTVRVSALAFEIATYKADTAKRRWLPKIDFEGKFGALPGTEPSKTDNLNSSVAIVATWEIFGGFNSAYEKRELYAQKNLTDLELKSSVIEILADVQIQFGELQAVQSRSDLEKDNARLAKRYYDLVLADFKRGYKNSGDFSAAAQTLYDAEVQKKKLDLEFIEKKLALENRLGRRISSVAMKDSVKEGSK